MHTQCGCRINALDVSIKGAPTLAARVCQWIGITIGLTEGLHTRAFKSRTLAEKQDMGLLKHTYMYTHCKKRGKKRMMT